MSSAQKSLSSKRARPIALGILIPLDRTVNLQLRGYVNGCKKNLFYCEGIEIFDGFLLILSVLLNKDVTFHEIISQQTFEKIAQQVGSKHY